MLSSPYIKTGCESVDSISSPLWKGTVYAELIPMLQMHFDLFVECNMLCYNVFRFVCRSVSCLTANVLHYICRMHSSSSKCMSPCIQIAKPLHLICRRHAPCSKSTPLYLQKACALLQELSFYSQKVCTLLRKYSTVFAEGMRFVAKALSHYGRRHAPCSKSNPL